MTDLLFMRLALKLARQGYGATSPNPMVGAVVVKRGRIIGRGWHHRAGEPHAEIEALRDAEKKGHDPKGATLFVTLEPCSTHGRTPPCTDAIIAAGLKRVVVGAVDPNPKHAGKAFKILRRAGIEVISSKSSRPARRALPAQISEACVKLNESFNHWIIERTPFVTVKAAMTLDGKIATASGESKWITGAAARAYGMKLRRGADAILVGINTILADDSSLTFRKVPSLKSKVQSPQSAVQHSPRRIILDSQARTPLTAKVVTDEFRHLTTLVVTNTAPARRVKALAARVKVLIAPPAKSKDKKSSAQVDLRWLLKKLGAENVTSLLVEGGGEVNASFLLNGLAQRVAFFYAPTILGGGDARKGVAGAGIRRLRDLVRLREVAWRRVGEDLLLTARAD